MRAPCSWHLPQTGNDTGESGEILPLTDVSVRRSAYWRTGSIWCLPNLAADVTALLIHLIRHGMHHAKLWTVSSLIRSPVKQSPLQYQARSSTTIFVLRIQLNLTW